MDTIKINTFLPDGTQSGELEMSIDNILNLGKFSYFMGLCRKSDEETGTAAAETIKTEIISRIAELKNPETGEYKSQNSKEKGEKLEKKLLIICPELKQAERKLKLIAKNQLYFATGTEKTGKKLIYARLGDKYKTPSGICVFIGRKQAASLKTKPKFTATEEKTGFLIKSGSLKEIKSFLILESTENQIKQALETGRQEKKAAEMVQNARAGKIDRDKIKIDTNDPEKIALINMHLTDIYNTSAADTTTAEEEAEQAEEPTETTQEKQEKECITMKENTTNTAVQAETMPEIVPTQAPEQAAEKAENQYTAEEVQKMTGFKPEYVIVSNIVRRGWDEEIYTVFCAAFVAGTSYKIPAKKMKSAAAEVVFTVVSNSGKSLKINIYEKYNGKISEQMSKTKKLCPGGHGHWWLFDPETKKFAKEWQIDDKESKIEFIQVDTIDLANVSRWTSGNIACYDCIPISHEDFEAWQQNTGAATANPAQAARKAAEELDFTPVFYPVSEELAKQHKHMISWSDYKPGTVTAEYQNAVKEAYELARKSSDPEKSLYLAECYSRRLSRWYDDFNRNGAACPSVMICGAGNFPTRRKEKQNARFDTLMKQYNKIKQLLDKIEKPHGYGVEIRRDTITAEEFENILYFETIINESENRLQLIFDGKPDEEEINILKRNGFRWSPRFKAWQRQLTENAVAATWEVVKQFDELEDTENAEIQAKTEEIKAATPESERTETAENPIETVETEQETAKLNNIDLSNLPCLNGENIPCFVPDSYIGLYSTAQALKENADNSENEKYFREQISRILKKYIADAESVLAVYGAEALEIFEYAEIFNSFIYGELSEEISTAKEKGLKIFAEYHTEPEQEEPEQPETIPTNAEETGTFNDWGGVKFEPIPGFPDPETVGAEAAEISDKLAEALEKLNRMRKKLDIKKYISPENSRYYAGFLSAVCCIFGTVIYDETEMRHYLQAVSETAVQPEETAQAEAEENNIETVQTAETETTAEAEAEPETSITKFETDKIYSAVHITNSDYISAYRIIKRTAKFVTIEHSDGKTSRHKITIIDGCEVIYPDGVYSMCIVLRATDAVTAGTPRQAEQDYHRQQQETTRQAVQAAQIRITQTKTHKITMVSGAAR
ncbi:MAG: hypothetical protein J6S85_13670 [Methanobrevibacter sp.]|nr:hypothetical protein [Methanobrevibacter sp.]